MTNNKTVLKWLDEVKELVSPDKVVWIDGSEEQLEGIRKEAVESGEMIKLNEEKLPGCYLHRTRPNDVARVEDRTFICSKTKENAGPTNNWCDPQEMYKKLYDIARGSYKGRTMYIIPFSMGPIGSSKVISSNPKDSNSFFKYSAKIICFGVLGVSPVDSSDCVSKLTYFKNLSTKVILF